MTVIRYPIADTYDSYTAKDTNYGSSGILRVRYYNDGYGTYYKDSSYIKFDLTNPPVYSQGCYLHLTLVGAYTINNADVIRVNLVTNSWEETELTYNNSPNYIDADYYPSFNLPLNIGDAVDIDVTSYVNYAISNGFSSISFQIEKSGVSPSADYYYDFGSRESDHKPELIFYDTAPEVHYYAKASMSVGRPFTKVYAFGYPDLEYPTVPEGYVTRTTTDDSYLVYPSTDSSLNKYDYVSCVQAGVNGIQTALVTFDVNNLDDVWTAKLQMYCVASKSEEDYLVLRVSGKSLTYDNVQVYVPAPLHGLVEIDVTPIVKNALHDIYRGGDPLTFAIDVRDQTKDREVFMQFSTLESPITFKPRLVINPVIPELQSAMVYVTEDAFISSDRPVQTAPDYLPFAVVNHDLAMMPVQAADPYSAVYLRFRLDEINGTIHSAKLRMKGMPYSTFHSINPYTLKVSGVSTPFDKTTVGYPDNLRPGYCSVHTETHNTQGYTLTCPVIPPENEADEFEIELDVTEILRRSMYGNGILFFIEPDATATPTNAVLYVGGRIFGDGAWLELELEPRFPQPIPEISEIDGRAIIRAERESFCVNIALPGGCTERGMCGTPEVALSDYGATYDTVYSFDMSDVPSDKYPLLDMAVIWIPYIGVFHRNTPNSDCYQSPVYWEVGVVDTQGNTLFTTYYAGQPEDYHELYQTIINDQYYMQIDLSEAFRDWGLYSSLKSLENKTVRVALLDYHTTDILRLGTREGAYPAYLDLQWKLTDNGLKYYVHGDLGGDDRDGLTISSAWKTLNHSSKNVPEGHTLHIVGNYNDYYDNYNPPGYLDDEPAGNQISPTNNHVTYKVISNPEVPQSSVWTYQNIKVEINPEEP